MLFHCRWERRWYTRPGGLSSLCEAKETPTIWSSTPTPGHGPQGSDSIRLHLYMSAHDGPGRSPGTGDGRDVHQPPIIFLQSGEQLVVYPSAKQWWTRQHLKRHVE